MATQAKLTHSTNKSEQINLSPSKRLSSLLKRKPHLRDEETPRERMAHEAPPQVRFDSRRPSSEHEHHRLSTAERLSSLLRRKSSPGGLETANLSDKILTDGKYRGRGNLYRRFCIKRRHFRFKRRIKRRRTAPPRLGRETSGVSDEVEDPAPKTIVEDDCDCSYKILLLGDSGVGKTGLVNSLRGQPQGLGTPTIGIDHVSHVFTVGGLRIKLQIWDLPGQNRFRTMRKSYYNNVKGIILVYDVTNVDSFAWLGNNWFRIIDRDIEAEGDEPIPVYMVANKCDNQVGRQVSPRQGQEASSRNLCLGFYEASAKTGDGVEKAFNEIAFSIADVHNPKLTNPVMRSSFRKKRVTEVLNSDTGEGKGVGEMNNMVTKQPTPLPSTPPPSRRRWKRLLCSCGGQ